MKIVVYQGAAKRADKNANLKKMDSICQSAAIMDADVVVFPELFVTGYNLGEDVHALAEPLHGDTVNNICTMAIRHQLAIICGIPEASNGNTYNSAVVISAAGDVVASHRKVFLFGDKERSIYTPGTEFKTFSLAGYTCGLSICYDIELPESSRRLAAQGARIIFNPTANMTPYDQPPVTLARARALENGAVIVYANLCGQEDELEYTGLSAIIAPDGNDLARAGSDTCLLMADLSAALQRNAANPLSTQLEDLKRWQNPDI